MLPENSGVEMEQRLVGLLWDSSLNSWTLFTIFNLYVSKAYKVCPQEVPWPMRMALRGKSLVSIGAMFSQG
jgi:hypothetical protein